MIKLNIKNYLIKMGYKPSPMTLKKMGFTHQQAKYLLYDEPRLLNLDYLFILCSILHCTPNDLMVLTEDAPALISNNHPLLSLQNNQTPQNPLDLIRSINPSKINEVLDMLKEMKGE